MRPAGAARQGVGTNATTRIEIQMTCFKRALSSRALHHSNFFLWKNCFR